jgi:hypothetical protein
VADSELDRAERRKFVEAFTATLRIGASSRWWRLYGGALAMDNW